MRLIDADALCRLARNSKDRTVDCNDIMRMPTIDAVPSEELFNLFTTITAAEYGKQRFFMQKDGTVYDRYKGDYLHNFDLAVVRFCNELSDY